jgi:hypothetical protein
MALMGPESANETPPRAEDLANEDYEEAVEPRHSHRLVGNFLNRKIKEENEKFVLLNFVIKMFQTAFDLPPPFCHKALSKIVSFNF